MTVPFALRAHPVLVSIAFWFAIVSSVLIGVSSLRYLLGDPRLAGEGMQATVIANGWIFATHAGASAAALIVGGFQFLGNVRRRWPRLHRWTGRFYVLGCVVGAGAALWIAPDAASGRVATFGFSVLAAVWLYTTLTAWRLAMARDFAAHRRWMIRSFALTFGAVTLRLQILAFLPFGLMYNDVAPFLAYSAWIPNLLAVELAFLLAAGGAMHQPRHGTAA